MSKFCKPLPTLTAVLALSLFSANALAVEVTTDNTYLQTGQRDTSALNQFDGAAVQANAAQAVTAMQQDVAQQAEQNKNYIQQVQQQIIQSSNNTANNSAQPAATTSVPAASAPAANTPATTTPAKTDNNAAVQTSTPSPSSAPATPTGIDSGSAPNNGGGSWNYGF